MSHFPDNSGKKNAIQSSASTVTYLQRYTLTGALGIVVQDEDNDGGKDDLAISDSLTQYIKEQNELGRGAKALIKEFEEKWNLMPVVKEHVVLTELKPRVEKMIATLSINNNEQSINQASQAYNTEIMDLCRVASIDPKPYLDEVRAAAIESISRIKG